MHTINDERPDRIPEFIAKAKNKSDPFRLMGFGHRVYKNYDPRARSMALLCKQVSNAAHPPTQNLPPPHFPTPRLRCWPSLAWIGSRCWRSPWLSRRTL